MKSQNVTRKYVPEKFSRLIQTTIKMEGIEAIVNRLKEDIVLDIIDGWTTGDTLLDFVLVACNGTFDKNLYDRYEHLSSIGLNNPNQQIIVVQKALCDHEDLMILRDIFLAELRPEETRFDINTQLIHLPVKTRYLSLMHAMNRGVLFQGHKILETTWLTTGVLHSQFSDYVATSTNQDGFKYVPVFATCDIEIMPTCDKEALFTNHAIDKETLDHLYSVWTREKSARL